MTTAQAYFLTVALINLVLAFSGTRVSDPEGKQKSIVFFVVAFFINFVSWFLYVFDINTSLKIVSVLLSAAFIWGLVVFSIKRCELRLPTGILAIVFTINSVCLGYFTYTGEFTLALHVSAFFVPLALAIVGYLFINLKKNRNPSDVILAYACFFMALIVAARSFLLELAPDVFSKTVVSSQVIWPAFSVISGVFSLLSFTEEAQSKLKKESNTDQLTGLANRRNLDVTLNKEWARAKRHDRSLALIMLDLDFFKQYNDYYGHQAGDRCLQEIAYLIKESAQRAEDLAARYGGEEFLLILPDTDETMALQLAQAICTAVSALKIPHKQSLFKTVTISAGVAVLDIYQHKHADDLLKAADISLYKAKQNGRNQACIS
jgi:diguanylate cyclase (GGDEF)-like protein